MILSIYEGLQDELFCKIGKFAMDSNVIKTLGNPITTDKHSTWFVISEDGTVVGFCRLKQSSTRNIISNVYLKIDSNKVFDKLLQSTFERCDKNIPIVSYASNRTLEYFTKNNFKIKKQGVNWHTVIREKI